MIDAKNQHSLLDLLPYNKTTMLKDRKIKYRVLSIVVNLLNEMAESLTNLYEKNDLLFFDPHVGENLCQIRACQILDIYFTNQQNVEKAQTHYKQELDICINKLKKVELLLNSNTINDEHVRVEEFLSVCDINFTISSSTFFLTLSHFLTKFKGYNNMENTIINYSNLISDWRISKNLSRRMIHQYQKKISQLSCDFIKSQVSASKSLSFSPDILNFLLYSDDDGRYTLPCYLVMLVLIKYLVNMKVDILFIVRSEYSDIYKVTKSFIFSYNESIKDYQLLDLINKKQEKKPCFVVSGVTCSNLSSSELIKKYITKVTDVGLINLIMANMAGHPQYSGKKLKALRENPFTPLIANCNTAIARGTMALDRRYRDMKKLAQHLGCTQDNNNLFFIRHIFTDVLKRQLAFIENGQFYADINLMDYY